MSRCSCGHTLKEHEPNGWCNECPHDPLRNNAPCPRFTETETQ